MATHRLDKLLFSGKEEDFLHFQEQFESRMFLLKLRDTLLNKTEALAEVADETGEQRAEREAAADTSRELKGEEV